VNETAPGNASRRGPFVQVRPLSTGPGTCPSLFLNRVSQVRILPGARKSSCSNLDQSDHGQAGSTAAVDVAGAGAGEQPGPQVAAFRNWPLDTGPYTTGPYTKRRVRRPR